MLKRLPVVLIVMVLVSLLAGVGHAENGSILPPSASLMENGSILPASADIRPW